jgi:glutathione S-transferase
MIELYGFAPVWGLADLSPFVMKVDTYLRLSGLPYKLVPFSMETMAASPKGKLPYIVDGEQVIADSSFILEYCQHTYGNPLDAELTGAQRAIGHATVRMLEENLYWVLVAERWRDSTAAVDHYPVLAGAPADLVRTVVDTMLAELRGHGMGRHAADEIAHIGACDLEALSATLGDRPFLLGASPSSYDASAYTFVAHFVQAGYDSRMRGVVQRTPNLMSYWERVGNTLRERSVLNRP